MKIREVKLEMKTIKRIIFFKKITKWLQIHAYSLSVVSCYLLQ